MTDFNIQQFLQDMRREQREDHEALSERVEAGFQVIAGRADKIASDLVIHEKKDLESDAALNLRLNNIEQPLQNLKWFSRASITAFLLLIVDLVVNHVPRWISGK